MELDSYDGWKRLSCRRYSNSKWLKSHLLWIVADPISPSCLHIMGLIYFLSRCIYRFIGSQQLLAS